VPRLGVDTGGTFTDLVLFEGEEVRTAKVPSTPDDPSLAIARGIEALGGLPRDTKIVHGTTVALNALLTGRTARTALVTNSGFRDLIEIGRQERPDIYALHPRKVTALVPRELRFEIAQRSWPAHEPDGGANGMVTVQTPTERELEALRLRIAHAEVESVAVCLLHAYADPSIEEEVARALAANGLPITCSAGILRAHREFERFSTAVVNAALVPVLSVYLDRLRAHLAELGAGSSPLSVLQSSGGALIAEQAAREPVRVLLSGPAGGVVGAARAAAEAGLEQVARVFIRSTNNCCASWRRM
jgi:N-methylhydantoinase A